MKFHSSWDWLMPVINKIYLSNNYIEYLYLIIIDPSNINSTYNDVVEYIKWYELQNK